MPKIGEVKEVHSNGQTASFVWRVRDFSRLGRGRYSSPSVEYFDREWWLVMGKTRNGINYVSLRRKPSTPGTPEPVHFSIECKTSGGEERGAVRERKYPENGWWFLDIEPRWTIPSSAGVTLTCSFRKDDSPRIGVPREKQTEGTGLSGLSRGTQTEGAWCSKCRIDEHVNNGSKGFSRETQTEENGCQNDDHPFKDISISGELWKKLLLPGTGHDVLIRVGDKQFRAHKHILKSRSPVFAAMFGSDMAERDSVTIEDCDPNSFGQFLQFVYCGKADIASVGSALSLYCAGDKYDLPSLKKICVHFLKGSFSTTTVFEVASLAARHDEKELLQLAIAYFAENLKEVWCTEEWQRFLLANPIEANEMNLKALQSESSVHKKRRRCLGPDRGMGFFQWCSI